MESLNTVVKGSAAVARAAGLDVTYVSAARAFNGHRLCDSRLSFMSTELHPTVLGQARYAAVLVRKGVSR